MGYYACRKVKDLLPDYIIEQQGPDYEGGCNYDGDMWYAAADYILDLKSQRDELLAALKEIDDAAKESQSIIGFAGKLMSMLKKARVAIANAEKSQ